jgi:hypothetical protein
MAPALGRDGLIFNAAAHQAMDVWPPPHYVAGAMEFLLILSAMLSAVTGAFSGVRAPEARPHHAAAVQAEAPCLEQVQRVARREAPAAADLPRIAAIFTAPSFALAAPIPLYADRLIE